VVPIEPSGSLAFRVSSYAPPNRRQFKLTALLKCFQPPQVKCPVAQTLIVATDTP
jgi:hypothetical protein